MKKKELSIIIPTYNRCPYNSNQCIMNPLVWCLMSIVNSNMDYVHEIIVINDNSSDYTNDIIKLIKQNLPYINLKYVILKEKYNAAVVRNIGLKYTNSRYVFFMDDDCILSKNALNLAMQLYKSLEDTNIGALHFPVFLRKNSFDGVVSEAKIGKLLPEKGEIYTNFRMKPEESERMIEVEKSISIKYPIKIDFFHEVFLIETSKIKKVNGFCESNKIKTILSEGLFLSQKLKKYNMQHYQIIDSRLSVIHFRYGARIETPIRNDKNYIIPNFELSLEEMIKNSNIERKHTGGRGSIPDIIQESISTRYAVFLSLNSVGAENWKKKAFIALVNNCDENNMFKFPYWNVPKEVKIDLWEKSIKQGVEIYEERLF